jgi:hypothetical protein
MCFMWISEQTALVSLYTINWLVVAMNEDCVLCEAWIEYGYIIWGHAVVYAVNSRTAAVIVGFVVDEVVMRQVFIQVLRFPLPPLFHQRSILVFTYSTLLPEGQMDKAWEHKIQQKSSFTQYLSLPEWLEDTSWIFGEVKCPVLSTHFFLALLCSRVRVLSFLSVVSSATPHSATHYAFFYSYSFNLKMYYYLFCPLNL